MNILVTGGAGFIGSSFLNLFVPKHPERRFLNLDSLTYAGNPMNTATLERLPNYGFSRIDLRDADAIRTVVEEFRPDWIVHFAAETHVDRSIKDPRLFVESNVIGTLNLLEAARTLPKPPHFHHVSTDEVYGSLEDDGAFVETTPYDPSSPYSASKAASDHLVRAYHRTYGLPATLTNCSNNYGPRQFPEKLIPLMILNADTGEPLPVYGEGLNVRDWLYVDDHSDAIRQVIERGRLGETYNVGGSSERRNIDVVRTIAEIVADERGRDRAETLALITHVPDRPGHDFRYAIDTAKIERELGWRPSQSFESGIRQTVRWYLQNPAWVDSVRTGEYQNWMEANYADRQPVGSV